jgi:catechol 2,3-dioxygenase-like lactoylglutathione lyase family enzyme
MIKVKRIRHATFTTPDLAKYAHYFQNIVGLGIIDSDSAHLILASDCDQLTLVAEKGDQPFCKRIAFEISPDVDPDEVRRQLSAEGLSSDVRTDYLPGVQKSVTFTDPEGTEIELISGWTPTPAREAKRGIVARQLGHIALYSRDPLGSSDFYGRLLGFRVSDWVQDIFCFMRCGFDHHTLNFARGSERRVHHIAFELRDGAHMLQACDLLGRNKMKILWGPVRHGPGHNVAIYHRDPDGHLVEFFFGMDRMLDEELGYYEPQPWHEDRPQRPKVWHARPSDKWGVGPDPELLEFARKMPAA